MSTSSNKVAQLAAIAGDALFGECVGCNLFSGGFPWSFCDTVAKKITNRDVTLMKDAFVSKVIEQLEQQRRDVYEAVSYCADTAILRSIVGLKFGLLRCFVCISIIRRKSCGLQLYVHSGHTTTKYYFARDQLRIQEQERTEFTKRNNKIEWTDELSLIFDLTSDKRCYYDCVRCCFVDDDDPPPTNKFLLFGTAEDVLALGDYTVCMGWLDTQSRGPSHTRALQQIALYEQQQIECLVNIAVDVFFGKTSNCPKCNLNASGLSQIAHKLQLPKRQTFDSTVVGKFIDLFSKELHETKTIYEYSTFTAETKLLKACLGEEQSFAAIPCHTCVKINKSSMRMQIRRGIEADLVEYFFDKYQLQCITIKVNSTNDSGEYSKRLYLSAITPELVRTMNTALADSPIKLFSFDGQDVTEVTETANTCMIFGPSATVTLNTIPNVRAWINTNNYSVSDWMKTTEPFFCVSYFGGGDLNSLKAAEINALNIGVKWKRVCVDSKIPIVCGDVLCFVGSLDEWRIYVQKNLSEKLPQTYKAVYVYCLINHNPLPQFPFTVPTVDAWVVKNICFETPEFRQFYDYMASDGELKYYADTKLENGKVYAIYLPRPKSNKIAKCSSSAAAKPSEIVLRCLELLCPKDSTCRLRADTNLLVHHGKYHCKTPENCCVVGCNATFSEVNRDNKRSDHYRRCHAVNHAATTSRSMCAKEKNIMSDVAREAWLIGAQLNLITTTPIVGMDPQCIRDEQIYGHFMKLLDEFYNPKLAYAILYIVGAEKTQIPIATLNEKLLGANVIATRYHVLLACQYLQNQNVLQVKYSHDRFVMSYDDLVSVVGRGCQTTEVFYFKRVASELICNFTRCIFDVDVLLTWLNRGVFTNPELGEFLVCLLQETALDEKAREQKWFMFVDQKLHVHLHLLLMQTVTAADDTTAFKIARLVLRAIEETYTRIIVKGGMEDQQKIKDHFLVSYDISNVENASELIFDLATIIPQKNDTHSDFIIATVDTNNTTGIQRALEFSTTESEDVSDIITNDLLEYYPRLMNFHKIQTTEISMISTPLDCKYMYKFWNNKHWPWSGIINGAQVTSKYDNDHKRTKRQLSETIYAEYYETKLKSNTNQFVELVNALSRAELDVLTCVYLSLYDTSETKVRGSARDIQLRLVHCGLCVIYRELCPNTLRLYTKSHLAYLRSISPSTEIHSQPPITQPHSLIFLPVSSQKEIIKSITEYRVDIDYVKYFSQFDSPKKKSILELNYDNKSRSISFVKLVQTVDPNFLYNISSFLVFVDVTGYIPKSIGIQNDVEWGLVVSLKNSLDYSTGSVIGAPCRHELLPRCFNIMGPRPNAWSDKAAITDSPRLNELKFRRILRHLDETNIKRYAGNVVAEEVGPFTFTVKYFDLVKYDEKIPLSQLCGMCVQFGNGHTLCGHTGVQLKEKLRTRDVYCNRHVDVCKLCHCKLINDAKSTGENQCGLCAHCILIWGGFNLHKCLVCERHHLKGVLQAEVCNKCKTDERYSIDLGLCTHCGNDVYVMACYSCLSTSNIMEALCVCHHQEKKCAADKHTGYTIRPIVGGSCDFCQICKKKEPNKKPMY